MATIDIIDATVRVETFRASDGGCLGYLVVDAASGAAWAIDPRLDQVDRFIEALHARGARLIYVLDTHTHADHLSGVRRLGPEDGRDHPRPRRLEAEASPRGASGAVNRSSSATRP